MGEVRASVLGWMVEETRASVLEDGDVCVVLGGRVSEWVVENGVESVGWLSGWVRGECG